jgi:hypothetical protein
LLQHLLGVVAAALLLQHWSELLVLGGAAGSWLQHQLLQPHIEWLMQAHPGGCCLDVRCAALAKRTCLLAIRGLMPVLALVLYQAQAFNTHFNTCMI